MRSLSLLIAEYPNKTGKEILEIQKEDERKDKERILEDNKKDIEFLESLKGERKYLKGSFGLNQRYVHRIDSVEHNLDTGDNFVNIESTQVVGFKPDENNRGVMRNGEYLLEIKNKTYIKDDFAYYFGDMEIITEEEFNAIYQSATSFFNFFK